MPRKCKTKMRARCDVVQGLSISLQCFFESQPSCGAEKEKKANPCYDSVVLSRLWLFFSGYLKTYRTNAFVGSYWCLTDDDLIG